MAPWMPPERRGEFPSKAAPWTAALPVSGCREMTQAAFDLIRERLAGLCEVETIFADRLLPLDGLPMSPTSQLQQLASGYPSNLALPGVEWTALGTSRIDCVDPESTGAGLIHVTPSMAASVSEIIRATQLVETTAPALGLEALPMTVNIVDSTFAVMVISVGFPRTEAYAFVQKARNLEAILSEGGFMPYRIGFGQEEWVPNPSNTDRNLYRNLKATFDPKGILATSKYAALYERPKKHRSKVAKIRKSLPLAEVA